MKCHPRPWRVMYDVKCKDTWHPKSLPCIVDADGCVVVLLPQNVCHPGDYDELADHTAQQIVAAVNNGQ